MNGSTERDGARIRVAWAAGAALWVFSVGVAGAQVTNFINITSQGIATEQGTVPVTTNTSLGPVLIGDFIDGNSFIRRTIPGYEEVGSGSGMYRRLFDFGDGKVTTNNTQEGYNRPGAFDAGNLGGFDYTLRVSNLTLDASGQYYVFALDVNESGNSPETFISLDNVRIYTTNAEPAEVTDNANIDNLGTLRYAMNNSATQNHVLIEYGLTGLTGSGKEDLFLFVKASLFTGAQADDLVLFYSSMGQFSLWNPSRQSGFDPNNGFEEWAVLQTRTTTLVPEPPAVAFGVLGLLGCLWYRARRRR